MGSFLSQHEGLEVQLAIRWILLGIRAATHAKVQNGVKAHFLNILYSIASSAAYSGVNWSPQCSWADTAGRGHSKCDPCTHSPGLGSWWLRQEDISYGSPLSAQLLLDLVHRRYQPRHNRGCYLTICGAGAGPRNKGLNQKIGQRMGGIYTIAIVVKIKHIFLFLRVHTQALNVSMGYEVSSIQHHFSTLYVAIKVMIFYQ